MGKKRKQEQNKAKRQMKMQMQKVEEERDYIQEWKERGRLKPFTEEGIEEIQEGSLHAIAVPINARLSDSVPPDVNVISDGRHPRESATCFLALRSAAAAALPI